jgi:hypothetical protein
MTEFMIESEIKDFLLRLFPEIAAHGIEHWSTLSANEFGVLSWHLGNFYILGMWSPE